MNRGKNTQKLKSVLELYLNYLNYLESFKNMGDSFEEMFSTHKQSFMKTFGDLGELISDLPSSFGDKDIRKTLNSQKEQFILNSQYLFKHLNEGNYDYLSDHLKEFKNINSNLIQIYLKREIDLFLNQIQILKKGLLEAMKFEKNEISNLLSYFKKTELTFQKHKKEHLNNVSFLFVNSKYLVELVELYKNDKLVEILGNIQKSFMMAEKTFKDDWNNYLKNFMAIENYGTLKIHLRPRLENLNQSIFLGYEHYCRLILSNDTW